VEHSFDLHFCDGTAGHGGKKDATQRVTKCMAKTPIQGFESNLRRIRPDLANLDDIGLQNLDGTRLHQILSLLADYFE
jgi:hypothetical protein